MDQRPEHGPTRAGEAPDRTPRAMLVDLDGVLRIWDGETEVLTEQVCGLPPGAIRAAAFAKDLLEPAIKGQTTDERWRARVAERLHDTFPDANVDAAVRLWSESSGRLDGDLVPLLRACRRTARVALMTNATSRLHQDLDRLGLSPELDHIFNSSELGFIKPEREIFQRALNTLSLEPHEVYFIDDTAGHVEAATNLGIRSHHYTGLRDLRRQLHAIGLLD